MSSTTGTPARIATAVKSVDTGNRLAITAKPADKAALAMLQPAKTAEIETTGTQSQAMALPTGWIGPRNSAVYSGAQAKK